MKKRESTAKEGTMQYRDMVQTMTESERRDLNESYQYNLGFVRHLTQKTNDLQKYEKAKRKRVMGE